MRQLVTQYRPTSLEEGHTQNREQLWRTLLNLEIQDQPSSEIDAIITVFNLLQRLRSYKLFLAEIIYVERECFKV